MKFDTLFDFKYFIKDKEEGIKDKDFLLRVKSKQSEKEINDADYFLLMDSLDSYLGELKLHCSKKPFYKNLMVSDLNHEHLKSLFSFMTHVSIGLNNRMVVRDNVDLTDYENLYNIIGNMVESIIKDGFVSNSLYEFLK